MECNVSSSGSESFQWQTVGPHCDSWYAQSLCCIDFLGGLFISPHFESSLIIGPSPNAQQDSFMYRVQNGVRSLLLDDDNCDCYTTLSMGHGMCGSGFSTSYGPSGRFGVDLLYDTHCQTPDPKHSLSLYFRGIHVACS